MGTGTNLMRRVTPVRRDRNDASEVAGEDVIPRLETGVHTCAAAEERADGPFPRRVLAKIGHLK